MSPSPTSRQRSPQLWEPTSSRRSRRIWTPTRQTPTGRRWRPRPPGAPLARPEIVVRPRTEEDVAAVLVDRGRAAHPGRGVGRRVGDPGRRPADPRRHRARPALARPRARRRRDLDDRHGPGGRERPASRVGAERPRADAAALPRLGRVGDGRRLHRGPRLGRALHALRQDRGPAAQAARRDSGHRADRDGGGAAARRRARS